MIATLKNILAKLEGFIGSRVISNLPDIDISLKRAITKHLPVISLAFGLICLYMAFDQWHNAEHVTSLIQYANQNEHMYGIPSMPVSSHMDLAFWLGILILIIMAYLFFKAISRLKAKNKEGWNLVYYAIVINVGYGVIMLLNYYGGNWLLIEHLLFSVFCLYFLFEVRALFKTDDS